MGRNKANAKRVRAEKSKVKLKQKKYQTLLPKGQNVTNTAFKVKPVIIVPQFRGQGEQEICESTSTRFFSLKEVLSRTRGNTNDMMCEQAFQDLLTMIADGNADIAFSLNEIVTTTCHVFNNPMRGSKTRMTALKTLDKIAENYVIDAFIPHVALYLRNMMTHKSRQINEDSLYLLDILFERKPVAMVEHVESLLTPLLGLISNLNRSAIHRPSLNTKLNNTKLNSVEWYRLVLGRLLKIFEALHTSMKESVKIIHCPEADTLTKSYHPLYVNRFTTNGQRSWSHIDFTGVQFQRHISAITTLMHAVWLEVAPELPAQQPDTQNYSVTMVSGETMNVLRLILQIKYIVTQLTRGRLHKFSSARPEDRFMDGVLARFPFATNPNDTVASNVLSLPNANAMIAYLYLTGHTLVEEPVIKMLRYLTDLMQVHKPIKFKCLLSDLLEFIFVTRLNVLLRMTNKVYDLFDSLISYLNYFPNQTMLYRLLASIADFDHFTQIEFSILDYLENDTHIDYVFCKYISQNPHSHHISNTKCNGNIVDLGVVLKVIEGAESEFAVNFELKHAQKERKSFISFLKLMPNLLIKHTFISEEMLDIFLLLSKKRIPAFDESLIVNLPLIIDNLAAIQVRYTASTHNYIDPKLKILMMYYYNPHLKKADLKRFDELIKNPGLTDAQVDAYTSFLKHVLPTRVVA